MENKQNSITQFAMMQGLYLGLALILNSVIFYVLGVPFSKATGYIQFAIALLGVGYSMYTFARLDTEAGLPYSRALGLGTLQTLFAGILVGFYTFILYKYIDVSLIDKLMAYTEQEFLKQGRTEEQVELGMGMIKKMMTPTILSISQPFNLAIFGFFISLILAIFLKKEPANPFHEVEDEEEE